MDLLELWDQMGLLVKLLMAVLAFMSMWSVGVFFERLFTFSQAKSQSKLFAPQVARHLKDSKLKDGIAVSQSKNYRYSHLAKVVLAGLQEYQFQQESGGALAREDQVTGGRVPGVVAHVYECALLAGIQRQSHDTPIGTGSTRAREEHRLAAGQHARESVVHLATLRVNGGEPLRSAARVRDTE